MTFQRAIHNQVAPDAPYTQELAVFDVQSLPYALGALEARTPRHIWADDSYLRGEQLIRRLQLALLTGGMADLLEGQNRLYRLLNSALYGQTYEVQSYDPLVIAPNIPAVPDQTIDPDGLLWMVNELPGMLDQGWFGIGGRKATLADIVQALRIGSNSTKADLWDKLKNILDVGSDLSSMGNLIQGLFFNAVETGEEAGIFTLLAAAVVGNLATTAALGAGQQAQTLQLQRIIRSLDGGGLTPPGDDLLTALRGDDNAGADRNVVDALKTDLLAKLEAIRVQLEQQPDNTDLLAKLEAIREQLV